MRETIFAWLAVVGVCGVVLGLFFYTTRERPDVPRETEDDWLRRHRCHPDDLDDNTIPPRVERRHALGGDAVCMCGAAEMRVCREEPEVLRPPYCRLIP